MKMKIHPVFQPVFDLHARTVQSNEALMRMTSNGMPISPAIFIDQLEASGQMIEADMWIARQCFESMAQMPESYVSINISGRTFNHVNIAETLGSLSEEFKVAPQRITVELTEHSVIEDEPIWLAQLSSLKAMGFQLSLDDFGMGYNSYNKLRLFEWDEVKIDGALIKGMRSNPRDELIVAHLVSLIQSLQARAVAEHIENASDVAALRRMGIRFGQGYFLGLPSGELKRREETGSVLVNENRPSQRSQPSFIVGC